MSELWRKIGQKCPKNFDQLSSPILMNSYIEGQKIVLINMHLVPTCSAIPTVSELWLEKLHNFSTKSVWVFVCCYSSTYTKMGHILRIFTKSVRVFVCCYSNGTHSKDTFHNCCVHQLLTLTQVQYSPYNHRTLPTTTPSLVLCLQPCWPTHSRTK